MWCIVKWFVLLSWWFQTASAAVRLSPAPLSVSSSTSCPRDVVFTCVVTASSSNQLSWWLNGDQVVSYSFPANLSSSSFSSSSPVFLAVPNRFRALANVTITVNSAQSDGQSYGWTSRLFLNLVPGALLPRSNVSCGSGSTRNTSTVSCTLPQIQQFLQSPSDSSCNLNESVSFFCLPPPFFTNVSWEVSGTSLRIIDTVPSILYRLQVPACQSDWKNTAVQCVARRGNTKVFSKTAYLSVNDSNQVEQFLINEEQEIFAFLVGVATAVLLLLCCILSYYVGYCLCRRQKEPKTFVQLQELSEVPIESGDSRRVSVQLEESVSLEAKRSEQRLSEMKTEKKVVLKVMRDSLGNLEEEDILECGSRLQKYSVSTITSVAIRPTTCALNLALKEQSLKTFLSSFQHENVHRICSIKPAVAQAEEEDGRTRDFVIVTQPVFGISLRDLIYGEVDPFKDWADKYGKEGVPLPPQKVNLFGNQILQAILYLYNQRFEGTSLKPLGHVQPGNIFVKGDVCKLGGYDNTLIGYRSNKYSKIANNGSLDYIDTIMFGYVVFEMCAASEVQGLLPTDEEYASIGYVKCETLLRYIFTRKDKSKSSFKHNIHDISKHAFFKDRHRVSETNLLGRIKGQLHTGKHSFTKSLDSTSEDQRYLVTREDD